MKTISVLLAYTVVIILLFWSCNEEKTLYSNLRPGSTNIHFENVFVETMELNPFTFDYVYHGAGVAAGDVNNDGLVDLYFAGNTVSNKLYLNEGDLEFKDISRDAGVEGKKSWATGVSMVDINGDGWLDIYVCYSGIGTAEDRAEQLFINNGSNDSGIPTFTERAKEYGLDAPDTYSTQASFFDYDLDGDLDMFLLNHSLDYRTSPSRAMRNRLLRHPQSGNRLYRNDNNKFVDASEEAGIYGGWLNIGLSMSVSDFNNDHYPDLYVSNDFDEQDYFYVNNRDGTFTQSIEKCFPHISKFSMGSDIADFNNDNLPDLITLDMLPEDNYRQKLLRGPDDFDRYTYLIQRNYHRQHMRNMLHLNQGLKDGLPVFSEIGQLAGVSNTDWSWSSLFGDYDNDGNKDLFITNGYVRDLTNLDFQRYDFEKARQDIRKDIPDLTSIEAKQRIFDFMTALPGIQLSNYIFRNTGHLQFQNNTKEWGLEDPRITTGAAYADLDNDGDLDLITNNINSKASIYRNNSENLTKNHFINIKLEGRGKNTKGIGAKLYIETALGNQFAECYVGRGFLSTVDYTIHFGVGNSDVIKSLKVIWPDKSTNLLQNISVDTTITIAQNRQSSTGTVSAMDTIISLPYFRDVTEELKLMFVHNENAYVDFKHERLLLYQLSKQGPRLASGDVNDDGREDFFIGGAIGQSAKLFLGLPGGSFKETTSNPWAEDDECEDMGCNFFDADNDNDLDLFVVSGGVENPAGSEAYASRLYINDGLGNFKKTKTALPSRSLPGSCVTSADFDRDGDVDVFVGGAALPGSYPLSSPSMILKNNTTKKSKEPLFTDVTDSVCPALKNPGIITDAIWIDLDEDGWVDLVTVGHWLPVQVFKNDRGVLTSSTHKMGLEETHGLWNTIKACDLDNDGDEDLIAGNIGLNSDLQASPLEPLEAFVADFDNNGRIDPLIFEYNKGVSYPLASRDDILNQIPSLKKKFVRYETYAKATVREVLDTSQQQKAQKFKVHQLQTVWFENVGGRFTLKNLPIEAQFSPVQSVALGDFNYDGTRDMFLLGNLISYRVEYGPIDASYGLLLNGDGKGNFKPVSPEKLGLYIQGEVRDARIIKSGDKAYIVIAKNNGPLQVIGLNAPFLSKKPVFPVAQ